MHLQIAARLDYSFTMPTDCLVQFEAAHQPDQSVVHGSLDTAGPLTIARAPAEDAVGERVWANFTNRMTWQYEALVNVQRDVPNIRAMKRTPMPDLPPEVVKYLFTSRYCPSDKFQNFVAAQFGHVDNGVKVVAMRDWIERSFAYVSGVSSSDTSALETFVLRQGICRDFAHVLITLCRASAIPARIVSVYALGIVPQDFHAVVEVWLDDGWHLIDPSGMADPTSMVRIGVGRDAADVAFLTSFGPAMLEQQWVDVRAVADPA